MASNLKRSSTMDGNDAPGRHASSWPNQREDRARDGVCRWSGYDLLASDDGVATR